MNKMWLCKIFNRHVKNKKQINIDKCNFARFQENLLNVVSEFEDKDIHKRIELLEYAMKLLIDDVQSSGLMYNFFNNTYQFFNSNTFTFMKSPFPQHYYLKDGTMCDISRTKAVINLSDTNIMAYLRKPNGVPDIIISERKGYDYHKYDTELEYYPYLNIAFVKDGIHHIAVGKYLNVGKANADVYAIEELFGHVRTDGAFFYYRNANQDPRPIEDVKIAALFHVAQLKYKEEQKLKNQQTE